MKILDWFKTKPPFESGYEYVLSEINKHGKECISRLEVEADNPFDFGDFDRGMIKALREIGRTM